MTISTELFYAILAMDSYNRGYEGGLADNGTADLDGLGDAEGTKIGTATVGQASSSDPDSADVAAGFYAISYNLGAGPDATTVISYRGTNNSWDYLTGWAVGAGMSFTWTQADEAIAFYSAVTGQSYAAGPAANTILTGHSLGGGLAQLLSMLSGKPATIFDHMPGGLAALIIAANDEQA
jgi:hypothetical protein